VERMRAQFVRRNENKKCVSVIVGVREVFKGKLWKERVEGNFAEDRRTSTNKGVRAFGW